MKKKLFASVLCIAMGVILLAGCGNSNITPIAIHKTDANSFFFIKQLLHLCYHLFARN